MKNNKFESLISFVGLNYKNEITKIAIIAFSFITLIGIEFIFLGQIAIIMATIILGIVAVFFYINRYFDMKVAILNRRNQDFITSMSYFQSFVDNGFNVYQAFEKIQEFSSEWLQGQIGELLRNIDNDKSVKPYIDFSNKFNFPIATNLLISIYQMVDIGENSSSFTKFNILFEQLVKNNTLYLKEKKERSLSSCSSFPLIGAVLITIVLSISLISIIGEIVNV